MSGACEAAAVVLAGGASRRMRVNKALLTVDGRPIIKHLCQALAPRFREVIISANDPCTYAFLGHRVVKDEVPARGPLMGMASALKASSADVNLVVPCDLPGLNMEMADALLRAVGHSVDAAVLRNHEQELEPLPGVYRKSLHPLMREELLSGRGRVRAVLRRCRTVAIDLPPGVRLHNLNTPAAYRAYIRGKA